ncbi:unnamed protein product [Orchesella dallaii]|uniref:PINIT domain-containing protein n=1 Tax=Orchesella dallaii TaxID=48710 RepID=A0ABP1R4B6_9HEXA
MSSNTVVPFTEEQVELFDTTELQAVVLKAVTDKVFRLGKEKLQEYARLINSRKRKRDTTSAPALYSVAEQVSVSTRVLSQRVSEHGFDFEPETELTMTDLKRSQQSLLPLPFYELRYHIVKPTMALLTGEAEHRMHMFTKCFFLRSRAALEYEYDIATEILLRIWALNKAEDHDDSNPEGLRLKVNDRVVSVPTNVKAINIDRYVDPIKGTRVHCTWPVNDTPLDYAFAVVMVSKRPIRQLLGAIKAKGVLPRSETGKLKTSTRCSITQKRLHSPCRAVTCTNCPAFNLEAFLLSHESRRYGTFKCVTCKATIKLKDLRMCV